MKKLHLIILLIFLPSIGGSYTIEVDTKAEWDAVLSSASDLQTFSDGLKFRYEDKLADFSNAGDYTGVKYQEIGYIPTVAEDSTNVPNSDFSTSRHLTTLPNSGIYFNTGTYAARLQPATIDMWLAHTAHTGDTTYYYVYCDMFGKNAPALWTWPWVDGYHSGAVTGFAYDVHPPFAPAQVFYYDGHTVDVGSVGWGDSFSPANLTWHKYTMEFDWANKKVRWYIDDDGSLNPANLRTSLRRNGAVSPETVTNGWIGFVDAGYLGTWGGFPPTWCPEEHTGFWVGCWGDQQLPLNPDYIDYVFERLNWTITPAINYYAATRFIRYRLHEANGTLTFDLTPAGGTVYSLIVSWVATVETDTNVTALYGRNMATDITKMTASSTAGTGYEAYQPIRIENGGTRRYTDKEWKSSGTSESWLKYDLVTPRIITCVPIAVGTIAATHGIQVANPSQTIKIEGSNNDSTWTSLYPATSWGSSLEFAKDITFTNTTAYRYYKITFGSGYQARVNGLELREAGDIRSASEWAGVSMESSISTNSGSDWSDWASISSGATPSGFVAYSTASTLRVRLRPTLTTDNQKYQPVISSLTLTSSSSPPISISGGKLTGGKTQ